MSPGSWLVAAVLVATSVVFLVWLSPPHQIFGLRKLWYTLPPGPEGLPVFGSLDEWLKVRKAGSIGPWVSRYTRTARVAARLHLTDTIWM